MKITLVLFLAVLISCANAKNDLPQHQLENSHNIGDSIAYSEFKPKSLTDFQLNSYDVSQAFQLDSMVILSAYSDGDLETSENPENWGDRLIALKNKSVIFESKGVGDVYLYEPNFYRNEINNKTIIICQLGYEYYFGGDVFLLENGKVTFLGTIDIDGTDTEISMTDIVQVSETNNSLNFHFNSDSLNFKPGNEDIIIQNTHLFYSYSNGKWKLNNL